MPMCLDFAQSIQRLEMFGLESVALDLAAAGLGIAGVEVQAMRAGQKRQRLVQIGPELVGRACLARIVAGDRQAASQLLAGVLEPADVVALPAVQRDRDGRRAAQGRHRHRRPIPRIAPSRWRRLVPRFPPEEVMAPSSEKAGMSQDVQSSVQFCPNADHAMPEHQPRSRHRKSRHE